VLGLGALAIVSVLAAAAGQSGAATSFNPVQLENARPGTRAWHLPSASPGAIAGYSSEVSVGPSRVLHLHVATNPAARYRIQIFRLGWYGGTGGRLLTCLPACDSDEAGASQPIPTPDTSTGYLDAGWPVTDTITVPSTWVSGYYLADLVLTRGAEAGRGSWVPFVVAPPPTRATPILVQASVNTWQAYNRWGGMSLYKNPVDASCQGFCTHVSFNRPYDPTTPNLWNWEVPLVHFLEEHGYDVSYTTDVDTDRNPAELLRHRLVVVAGHDEYWTKTIRDAFDAARDASTNLAFLGANIGYWQMRYDDERRTIVEYRSRTLDPEPNQALKTVRFRALVPPRPECELEGVQWYHDTTSGVSSIGGLFDYAVTSAALTDPWFSGTGFTTSSTLPRLVGYEWDKIEPLCQKWPPIVLFEYRGPPVGADSVRYVAASGARVFSAGSLEFTRGLDDFSLPSGQAASGDPRLERFLQNALSDLTLPAPPIRVRLTRRGPGTVTIRVTPHADPRVTAALIYRGRRLVCAAGRFACTDTHAPPGSRYAVVLRDRWGVSEPVRVGG
jgi:hypothetical protein